MGEYEISENQKRFISPNSYRIEDPKKVTGDSRVLNFIGIIQTPGVDGRDHDNYLYERD